MPGEALAGFVLSGLFLPHAAQLGTATGPAATEDVPLSLSSGTPSIHSAPHATSQLPWESSAGAMAFATAAALDHRPMDPAFALPTSAASESQSAPPPAHPALPPGAGSQQPGAGAFSGLGDSWMPPNLLLFTPPASADAATTSAAPTLNLGDAATLPTLAAPLTTPSSHAGSPAAAPQPQTPTTSTPAAMPTPATLAQTARPSTHTTSAAGHTTPADATPPPPPGGGTLTVAPLNLSFNEGVDSGYQSVATITDADLNSDFNAYQATIDWGDGTLTNGVVTGSNGSFAVLGDHTYTAGSDAPLPVTITVADVDGDQTTVVSSASVADAPLIADTPQAAATASALQAPTGTAMSLTIGTFRDLAPNAMPAGESALIDWGDHHTSAGTVAWDGPAGSGQFCVVGQHTYTHAGTFAVTATVTDTHGGASLLLHNTVTALAPLHPNSSSKTTGSGITPLGGSGPLTLTPGNNPVAEGSNTAFSGILTDTDGNGNGRLYSGTITWADTNTTQPLYFASNDVGCTVTSPAHTTTEEGGVSYTIVINDRDGASLTYGGSLPVVDATLTTLGGPTIGVQATVAYVGSLMTFSDANPYLCSRQPQNRRNLQDSQTFLALAA